MAFEEILAQVLHLLQREGRISIESPQAPLQLG